VKEVRASVDINIFQFVEHSTL